MPDDLASKGARLVARPGIVVDTAQGQRPRGAVREQARDTVRSALRRTEGEPMANVCACEVALVEAVNGACPIHGGDNCLRMMTTEVAYGCDVPGHPNDHAHRHIRPESTP